MRHFSLDKPIPDLTSDIASRTGNPRMDVKHILLSSASGLPTGTVYFSSEDDIDTDNYHCESVVIRCSAPTDSESLIIINEKIRQWASDYNGDILNVLIEFEVGSDGQSLSTATIYF